jgi:hypothetical protein
MFRSLWRNLGGRGNTRGARAPRRRPRTALPRLERLEDRLTPTNSATLTNGVLNINIDPFINASITLDASSTPTNKILDVKVVGGTFLKQFALNQIQSIIGVFQGGDTVTVGDANGLPFTSNQSIQLNAATGTNPSTLLLGKPTSSAFSTETVTPASSSAIGEIDFGTGASAVVLHFTAGFNELQDSYTVATYTVNALASQTEVSTGVINNAAFTKISDPMAAFTVVDFSSKTSVNLEMASLSAQTVSVDHFLTASAGLKGLTVDAPAQGDQVFVSSTPSNFATVSLNAHAQPVSFFLGSNSSDPIHPDAASQINGAVYINGVGGGKPNVEIDTLNGPSTSYTFDATTLAYTASGTTNFVSFLGDIGHVSLVADAVSGQPTGTIEVKNTPANSPELFISAINDGLQARNIVVDGNTNLVAISASANDLTYIGDGFFTKTANSDHSTVAGVVGIVSVSAGSLTVDDAFDGFDRTVTIDEQEIKGLAPGLIEYNSLQSLTVIGGESANTFTIAPSDISPTGQLDGTRTFNKLPLTVQAGLNGAIAANAYTVWFDPVADLNLTIAGNGTGSTLDFNDLDRAATIAPRVPPAPLPKGTLTATFPSGGYDSVVTYTGMSMVTAEPDANHSFVQSLFHNVLGRSGVQAELNHWVALLPTLGQEGAAIAINHLPEAEKHVVDGFFAQYLHAKPTAKEENEYVQELANGETQEQVLSEILGSPKFLAEVFVGSNESPYEAYIEALYKDLLGVPAATVTQREIKFWEKEIKRAGRAEVAEEFLESDAYRTRAVTQDFPTLVHRAPTARELDQYVHSDLDLLGIQEAIEGTSEFYNKGT